MPQFGQAKNNKSATFFPCESVCVSLIKWLSNVNVLFNRQNSCHTINIRKQLEKLCIQYIFDQTTEWFGRAMHAQANGGRMSTYTGKQLFDWRGGGFEVKRQGAKLVYFYKLIEIDKMKIDKQLTAKLQWQSGMSNKSNLESF